MAFSKKVNKDNVYEGNVSEGNAIATLTGTLKDVYEGEKYNYATVRCMRGKYYDDFSISFAKSVGLADGECECEVKAELSTFFDKNINRSKTVLTGIEFKKK